MNQAIITKTCSKCHNIKTINQFGKDISTKDQYTSQCKSCRCENNKLYRYKNPEKVQEQNKLQYHKNRQYNIQRVKIWNKQNSNKYKQNNKNFKQNHPTYFNEYNKNQRLKNINIRLKHNLRSRIKDALKNNQKYSYTENLLGCSIIQLKQYITSLFDNGMSWNNYGNKEKQWSIDHIIPCSIFDLTDPVEQKQCFHYTNLQPLWHKDNLKKGNHTKGLKLLFKIITI